MENLKKLIEEYKESINDLPPEILCMESDSLGYFLEWLEKRNQKIFVWSPSDNKDWKLIGHSYQIADTGDYDGHYEITNGKISLFTGDDDEESLQPIVDSLNNSGCNFYQDDWFEYENNMLKEEISRLRKNM